LLGFQQEPLLTQEFLLLSPTPHPVSCSACLCPWPAF
jgi:hypothetical protein